MNTYKHKIILPYAPDIEALKRKMDKLNIKIFFTYPNKTRLFVELLHK